MVPRDRDRIEIAHPPVGKVLLHVAHHSQGELGGEDAGVLRLVFLEDVGLHGAADRLQGLGLEPLVDFRLEELIAAHPEQGKPRAVVTGRQIALVPRNRRGTAVKLSDLLLRGFPAARALQMRLDTLIDGGVHEHRQNHRRRPVDGHGDRSRRQAQIEARVELLHVIERRDGDAGVAGASIDVGPRVRILAVQSRRVESRRQARCAVAAGQIVEPPVGPLGSALTGKHP